MILFPPGDAAALAIRLDSLARIRGILTLAGQPVRTG
jgi:hypothetical protein